jgi:hypothetical protein
MSPIRADGGPFWWNTEVNDVTCFLLSVFVSRSMNLFYIGTDSSDSIGR